MRKLIVLFVLATVCLAGCAAVRDLLLPGNDSADVNRRYWDQTTDNPYR